MFWFRVQKKGNGKKYTLKFVVFAKNAAFDRNLQIVLKKQKTQKMAKNAKFFSFTQIYHPQFTKINNHRNFSELRQFMGQTWQKRGLY
jgi:hypothetical protein